MSQPATADDLAFGTTFSPEVTLEGVRQEMSHFATEREWAQFHTPRNLVLALVGEVGELAEIFQWRGEVRPGLPGWEAKDRVHLGEEMADVLLYLVRLADRCGVDLPAAALDKMRKNRAKYPVDLARGKSAKYTAYTGAAATPSVQQKPPVPVESAPVAPSSAWLTVACAGVFALAAVASALKSRT